jgi:hypothetical protein
MTPEKAKKPLAIIVSNEKREVKFVLKRRNDVAATANSYRKIKARLYSKVAVEIWTAY